MRAVPIVGYCHECAEWVWVDTDRSCPKGHPASRVNGWYDSETGRPLVAPPANVPAPAPSVTAAGTRVGFLTDLMTAFVQNPAYSAAWGSDTDMTIADNPIDVTWGVGKERTGYTAALKVSETDHAIYFWESLKEHSSGLTLPIVGPEPSGATKATAVGPGSASWEWGYGTTRKVVEEVAARHGFAVHVVLTRRAATW
jgi:hypothetical protein